LRLLSGVSAPTRGSVRVVGRVAPLIGVGIGFNPELTGRENVAVNGRLLGLTADEVAARYDDIVAFADIGDAIEAPVKYYSSGMFLRLGFSVALHTDPDVFLIDEVLAVGDAAFQLRCFERLRQIQRAGTTIVIVTHNLQMLHQMAPRALLLSHGRLAFDGPVEQALGAYQRVMQSEDEQWAERTMTQPGLAEDQRFVGGATVEVDLLDADGSSVRNFGTGDEIVVRVAATFTSDVEDVGVGLMLAPVGLGALFSVHTQPGDVEGRYGPDRPLEAEVRLTNRLLANPYTLQVGITGDGGRSVLAVTVPENFYVTSAFRLGGMVDLEPSITIGSRPVPLHPIRRLDGESGG
jgi:ABC-type polysaccharide/polyol phosphate transport system ATPase subunit